MAKIRLYIQLFTIAFPIQTRLYSATADLHVLQFNVPHALGFSVFSSLNQATDL
jgi:hypothetical protein